MAAAAAVAAPMPPARRPKRPRAAPVAGDAAVAAGYGPQCERWCYTSYAAPNVDLLRHHQERGMVLYSVFQEEICPKDGRHHYQGFLVFKSKQRRSAIKVVL